MKKKKEKKNIDEVDTTVVEKRENGVENKGFDSEKAERKNKTEETEKWVKNYVPYEEYPAVKVDSISVENEVRQEVEEKEEESKEEEKGEKEAREEKSED